MLLSAVRARRRRLLSDDLLVELGLNGRDRVHLRKLNAHRRLAHDGQGLIAHLLAERLLNDRVGGDGRDGQRRATVRAVRW